VIASPSDHYRLDDLRRLATALTGCLGVAPERASAMASHLLWFDAAGASSFGIASLPGWLDRIASKQIDPLAKGRVILEHAGTAVFDAQQGLPPLALDDAAGIASEKARDVGIGIVRVRNIGPTGPAAAVAAGLAIGPFVALIAGPSPSLTMAIPTPEGLPAIYDSDLGKDAGPPEGWMTALAPWIPCLAGHEGWMILALSVPAMESLSTFHERAWDLAHPSIDGKGSLLPETLESRQREARERGVPLDPSTVASLKEWAGRANIPWPANPGG
jgi:LDH2 family malate/lactate/ureidoglycolate dehydrogenase